MRSYSFNVLATQAIAILWVATHGGGCVAFLSWPPKTCPVPGRPAVKEEDTASLAWQSLESQVREDMEEWALLS